MSTKQRGDFIAGYSGNSLLQKHSLNEYGFWKIRAADTNCDFGGAHFQADLGTVEGKLTDIIDYAVTLPGFWSWGSGDISSVGKPIKITPDANTVRSNLIQERDTLNKRIKEINANLKDE